MFFLNNFKCFLDYDPDKDYVIDLDFALKHIEYNKKYGAKRTLINHFCRDVNYTIHTEKNQIIPGNGGRPTERILMTPNTFKDLCMRANTEKAKRIRTYYIKMESIMFKYIKESLENTSACLEKTNASLADAQATIKILEAELSKIKPGKKIYDKAECVYVVVEEYDGIIVYKVGSAQNAGGRADQYRTHSNNAKIIYVRLCKNHKLLEKNIHYRLEEYKHNNRHDWFTADFATIKRVIDDEQLHMDRETMPFKIDPEFAEKLNGENATEDIYNPANHIPPAPGPVIVEAPQKPPVIMNPVSNFNRFIEVCFIQDPNAKTAWIDITSRYRLWARTSNDVRRTMEEYLVLKGYIPTFIYDGDTLANAKAFQGLHMIPLTPFTVSDNSTIVERFMYEKCVKHVTGRISLKELRETFVVWMQESSSNYTKLTPDHRKMIDNYCNQEFLGSIIHTGERIRYGYYGFCLKGKEYIGRKMKDGNRKVVNQINAETGEILTTYKSLTHAANELKTTIPAISKAITTRCTYGGFRYAFAEANED